MSRFSLIFLLAPACDPVGTGEAPADTADTAADAAGDTASDSGDTAEPGAAAVLSQDDVLVYDTLWATSVISGTVNEQGASGTIAYAESLNEGPDTCTATLTFTTVDSAPDCEGCEWGHDVVATPVSSTGSCTYSVPEVAFLEESEEQSYFAWYEDYTDEWDHHYDALLALESRSETSHSMSSIYLKDGQDEFGADAYDTATGALEFSGGSTGVSSPKLWDECDGWEWADSSTAHMENAQAGTVTCTFEEAADVWTVEAMAGQVIMGSVDTEGRNDDMELRLVSPDGCGTLIADSGLTCSGRGACGTFEYKAEATGTYSIVVIPSGCWDESVDYTLGVSVD